MAPEAESSYFPLDRCVSGDSFVLPWSSAVYTIAQANVGDYESDSTIRQFFADPEVTRILSKPFDAFSSPSSDSKHRFEQKTAAINVTPSADSRYDLKQIKEDALWLSHAVNLDEVAALRIAVVECQGRTAGQLLGPFTEEELAGIREAAGNIKYSSTIPPSLLSQGADPDETKSTFNSKSARQRRLLHTYLSERESVLGCVNLLLQAAHTFQARSADTKLTPSWVESRAIDLVDTEWSGNAFLLRSFAFIKSVVQSFENGCDCFTDEAENTEMSLSWSRGHLIIATQSLEIIFDSVVASTEITSSVIVLAWLQLVQGYQFFETLNSEEPSLDEPVFALQSFTAIISLAMLKLGHCIDYLSDLNNPVQFAAVGAGEAPYVFDKEALYKIQHLLLDTVEEGVLSVSVGPIILGWSALLQFLRLRVEDDRRQLVEMAEQEGTIGDHDPPVDYDDVIKQILEGHVDDPIERLAIRAVNGCRVFDIISEVARNAVASPRMRLVMLELIQHTTAVGYVPEVVEALISVLGGGNSYWDVSDAKSVPAVFDPVATFFQQEELVNAFLQNAASRYPFEAAPFLQLIRSLASSPSSHWTMEDHPLVSFLETLPIFTYQLPEGFVDYKTIQEEDNNNNIQLLRPIDLFKSRMKALAYGNERSSLALTTSDDFSIAAGTHGRIISDSGPRIAFWFHSYSPLKYFGKLLETFLTASNVVDATTDAPASREVVSELIELLASLISGFSASNSLTPSSKQDAIRILETASSGLSRNRDIVTVIFDIFDEELHRFPAHFDSEASLQVVVSCVHFIHALLPVLPRRVWPLLAQSGLLGTGRGGGRLAAIVEGIELVSGRFDFLKSCVRLYETLVAELIANTVRRRSGTKSNARYVDGDDFETGISDQILSKTLVDFSKYFIDVLESSWVFKYANSDDRRRLIRSITSTFNLTLQYSFGLVHNSPEASKQLLGVLVPAANLIVEAFLSTSSGSLRFQPLLCSYFEGLDTPFSTFKDPSKRLWTSHVTSVLEFSATLLRVGTLLNRPPSQYESQIFRASPIIARLYAKHAAYQIPTVLLFEALILAVSGQTSEPPSLLAHLGPQTSRNFIQILSDLDRPLNQTENVLTIWHFLSIVVSSRQQWFSNYLLTGKTPRAALQREPSSKDAAALDKPFLNTVLDKLIAIKDTPQAETLAILEFMASAQNFWPWTVYGSDKYKAFIESLLQFVGELKPIQKSGTTLNPVYQTRIAAYIAEILAMYLFHSRQTGTTVDFKIIQTNLEYFTRFAAELPPYNTSLHGNLKRNFETRYGGCTLKDFQRSGLSHRNLGRTYFYDLSLAEKMLRLDVGWNGLNNNGLRNEVIAANINLSLVDAQIALFQNWKLLAIELSSKLASEPDLRPLLAKVASDCLISNSRNSLSEEVFTKLSQTRADLALVLTQRLVQAGSNGNETKQILPNVWDNIRSLRSSFDRLLVGSEVPYYRTLLKILFLSLRVHTTPPSENLRASVLNQSATSLVPTLLEILKSVVASGLRELASSLHSTPEGSEQIYTPEDLALLTGILQTILQIPTIELHSSSLVNIFSATSTVRVATTLFSWSDTLAQNGDPVYGELSTLFLLELSSIPAMAEQMAIDGVLGQLTAANITSYLRRGANVGPFVDSAGGQRCYSIWVRGILPLLLNLLDSVQLPIAGEASLFLTQFPALLAQSSQAFDTPETNRMLEKGQAKFITLGSCSEVHSLTLITYILNGFRQQAGGEAIVEVDWDGGSVGENVEWWLSNRAVLRDRIVPMGEREVEWSRRKAGDGEKSLLENKVTAELLGVRDILSAAD